MFVLLSEFVSNLMWNDVFISACFFELEVYSAEDERKNFTEFSCHINTQFIRA